MRVDERDFDRIGDWNNISRTVNSEVSENGIYLTAGRRIAIAQPESCQGYCFWVCDYSPLNGSCVISYHLSPYILSHGHVMIPFRCDFVHSQRHIIASSHEPPTCNPSISLSPSQDLLHFDSFLCCYAEHFLSRSCEIGRAHV